MVDRGVEVGHGAGEIALLAPHHAHAVVRSGPTGAHGAGALEVVDGEVGVAEGAVAVGTLQVDAAVARVARQGGREFGHRSEEHTSGLQALMRISYADICLKQNKI